MGWGCVTNLYQQRLCANESCIALLGQIFNDKERHPPALCWWWMFALYPGKKRPRLNTDRGIRHFYRVGPAGHSHDAHAIAPCH